MKVSQANKRLDELFSDLSDAITANKYREELLIKISMKAENLSLRFCQLFERVGKSLKASTHKQPGLERVINLSGELDQTIITLQSKVNLSDFLLNEPANLFIKFGKESLLNAESLNEEDKILITVTLKNDRLIGGFLTPGEFLALLDKAKLHSGSDQVNMDNFLVEAKTISHQKYASRFEGVLLRLAELLAEVDHSTNAQQGMRQLKDERMFSSSTLASTKHMTGFSFPAGKPAEGLLQKLSPKELESLKREKEDLMHIYPQLREMDEDLETHQIDEEDEQEGSTEGAQRRLKMGESSKTFETKDHHKDSSPLGDTGYEVVIPVQRLKEFRQGSGHEPRNNSKGRSYGDLGKGSEPRQFSKTVSGFRVGDSKGLAIEKKGPVNGKHHIKIKDAEEEYNPHKDFDSQRVEAPMKGQIRPRSNDYRIKRASKSSGGTRPPQAPGAGGMPRVSPYAQPTPAEAEKRRRLQKLF